VQFNVGNCNSRKSQLRFFGVPTQFTCTYLTSLSEIGFPAPVTCKTSHFSRDFQFLGGSLDGDFQPHIWL